MEVALAYRHIQPVASGLTGEGLALRQVLGFSSRMVSGCRRRASAQPQARGDDDDVSVSSAAASAAASAETPSERLWARWHRFSVKLTRIAYKRRQWAHLGRWLKSIKQGVRQIPDEDVKDWWTAL